MRWRLDGDWLIVSVGIVQGDGGERATAPLSASRWILDGSTLHLFSSFGCGTRF